MIFSTWPTSSSRRACVPRRRGFATHTSRSLDPAGHASQGVDHPLDALGVQDLGEAGNAVSSISSRVLRWEDSLISRLSYVSRSTRRGLWPFLLPPFARIPRAVLEWRLGGLGRKRGRRLPGPCLPDRRRVRS